MDAQNRWYFGDSILLALRKGNQGQMGM